MAARKKKTPPDVAKGETVEEADARNAPPLPPPKPIVDTAGLTKLIYVAPTSIDVNWEENTSRSCLYKLDGVPCCFTEADVEDLVSDTSDTGLQQCGQQQAVTAYQSGKRLVLHTGYRRLYAFLLLHKLGKAKQIQNSEGGKIAVAVVAKPKDDEGWLAAAMSNLAENSHRRLSQLDLAVVLRRFAMPITKKGQFGLGVDKAGDLIAPFTPNGKPMKARTVARFLQLLKLSPTIQGKVHSGEMTMVQAVNGASETGSRASRGVALGRIRTMLEDERFQNAIADAGAWDAMEVIDLVSFISGHSEKTKHKWFEKML